MPCTWNRRAASRLFYLTTTYKVGFGLAACLSALKLELNSVANEAQWELDSGVFEA